MQYHTVLPLQFAGVAFCKSPKRDHAGTLKCRDKFRHLHHCTHLSILNCLFPVTCENISGPDGGLNTKCARKQYGYSHWMPQLKDWYTGDGIRVGEELWYCTWRVAPQTVQHLSWNCHVGDLNSWSLTYRHVFMNFHPYMNSSLYLC